MLHLLSGLFLQEQQRNTELIWGLWCPLTFLSPFQTKKKILQLLWKHDFLYRRAWQTWQAKRLSWHSAIFCDVTSRRSGVLTAAGHDKPLRLKGHLPSTSPNHQLPAACWRTSRAADSRCQGGTRGSTHEGRRSQLKLIGNKRVLGVRQDCFLCEDQLEFQSNGHFVCCSLSVRTLPCFRFRIRLETVFKSTSTQTSKIC